MDFIEYYYICNVIRSLILIQKDGGIGPTMSWQPVQFTLV